jgi:hypothetical protein
MAPYSDLFNLIGAGFLVYIFIIDLMDVAVNV